MVSENQHKPEAVKGLACLTQRESEVLQLLARGMRNKEIAKELYISEKTVRNHVSNIMRKLGIKDRTQLVLWTIRSGLANIK